MVRPLAVAVVVLAAGACEGDGRPPSGGPAASADAGDSGGTDADGGDSGGTDAADVAGGEGEAAPPVQVTPREAGWLRGDLHTHTEWSDGWDSVAVTIALAEYLEDPEFLAAHPEYRANGLDFLAVSDHRTVDVVSDPTFVSDRLVLVPSEEFGGDGHAGVPGVRELVHHDPDGDGTTLDDVLAAARAAHAQGALFSPNHPLLPKIPWPWDLREIDTLEVWNSGWALLSEPVTEEVLTRWEAGRGEASPFFRRAVRAADRLSSGQALVYYEALLARGVHVGLVGGSDRHAVVLPGFPTTYVLAPTPDLDGLLGGMAARHTYVTRTPASAQVTGALELGGQEYLFGDAVPVGPDGAEVTLRVVVGRAAAGGLLRLVAGGAVETDAALDEAELGQTLVEAPIEGDRFELRHTWIAQPGDWVYPVVLEPLVVSGATPEQEATVLEAALAATQSGSDVTELVGIVLPLVDLDVLGNPTTCDPAAWRPDRLQCSLADTEGMGSFFVPELLDRAMNAWVEDGVPGQWCMGAVASALRFTDGE